MQKIKNKKNKTKKKKKKSPKTNNLSLKFNLIIKAKKVMLKID